MHPFRKLVVWQKAHELTRGIYRTTESFPKREWYGLASQLRRAAVSVACNIVEGSQRPTNRDFAHYLSIALSSAAEAAYLVELCADLGYISAAEAAAFIQQYSELIRKIATLRTKVLRTQ